MICPLRRSGVLLLLLLVSFPASVPAQTPSNGTDVMLLFTEANSAYRDGRYHDAACLYQRIIDAGYATGDLYYNLGNTFFKNGAVGSAILNYRKALMLTPRHEDAQSNLGLALEQTVDTIQCQDTARILTNVCFWYPLLNADEMCAVFLAANALFWILCAVKYWFNTDFLTITRSVILCMAIVFGASLGVKLYAVHIAPDGIVIAREIMVRAGTSVNDTVLFKLHEGTSFVWKEETEGWVKIELCDGKKGWVQKETVGRVVLS